MTDLGDVVGEGEYEQNALYKTLQELITMRKNNKYIFLILWILLKTRNIILERKTETRMWQKFHAAQDNETPLRKAPESEGDRMSSVL